MRSRKSSALPPAAARDVPARGGDLPAAARVDRFLATARKVPTQQDQARGRLIFALDATMSRQPTWDLACHLQAELFDAAADAGGLAVRLAYFRGHDEARASRWVSNATELTAMMSRIDCRGGLTQIGRLLDHAVAEARKAPLAAFVYVGDTMEEDVDRLCAQAAALAMRNTRAFMFLEGQDRTAERAYREIARITGGVFLRFDAAAAERLRALLRAIGIFASGGRTALEATGTPEARELLADLRP